MVKRLLTVKEMASYLGVSPQTIYNGIARNSASPFPLKPVRVKSKPLFDICDADKFIEEQKAIETGMAAK